MRPKPQLVAADLDGTCVRYEPRLELDPAFADCLRPLLATGARWVMNSDRPVRYMAEIASYLPPEERPAALLSSQQKILFLDHNHEKYLPHEEWNRAQAELHDALWARLRPHLAGWREEVERRFAISRCFFDDNAFAFAPKPEEAEELRGFMTALISPFPEAQVSGNDEWSFILHRDFSKGRLLRETARTLGVATERAVAVGDGINDLSMLDGSVTPLVGCPANSANEVKAAVTQAGGVVSSLPAARGAAEVVRKYFGVATNED